MEAGDNTSYTSGMREAALHATAGRCPNIVAMLDAFEHRSSSGRHPVMVLEPCGASLLNVRRCVGLGVQEKWVQEKWVQQRMFERGPACMMGRETARLS